MHYRQKSIIDKCLLLDYPIIILIIIITTIFSMLFCDFSFIKSSDFSTFLSITIGYQVTSVAVLFNSKILYLLHESPDEVYPSKLHRLAFYYKNSIMFSLFYLFITIFVSDNILYSKYINNYITINIRKSIFFPAMFFSISYFFIRATNIFFEIFTIPRNE